MTFPSNWNIHTVGELCRRITSGGTPKRSNPEYYEPGTVPWIKTADLEDAYIQQYSEYISELGLRESSAKLLPTNTVLMAMYGATVGRLGILTEEAACNQASCALIANPAICDHRWLFYALLNDRDFIISQATGAAQQNLSGKTIRQFEYATPPLKEQQAIAEMLGALDDKIAANIKMGDIAYEAADALHEATVNSEISREPLTSIATTVLGGTPSRSREEYWTDGSVPWINSGKANDVRIIEPSAMITDEALSNSAAKLMPRGATVIAITGATLGKVARLEIEAAGNQSLVGIWSNNDYHNSWLHFALRREIPQLLRKATGAAQQHVNKQDVDSLLIPTPPDVILNKVGEEISNLLKVARAADWESLLLRQLRDTLLPQLMSGKLRVKGAEKVLEDAL